IVVPFTTLFPTFEGVEIYMAFVPALLVFPAYLLVRESGAGRWASVFGAGLLAVSAIWSLMVTWNAAYNLFGIFFLLFFLVTLVRYLREPSWRAGLLVALPLVLVGLSHQLTFLVALIVLLTAGAWLLWTTSAQRVTAVVRLAVPCVLLSLPLLLLYGPVASSVSTAGGGSSYSSNILWAFQVGPFFSWGYQGVKLDAVVFVDLVLSFLAIAYLGGSSERNPFAVAMAGVLLAATIVVLLDPGNAARGLYFLPIPFMAPIPVYLEHGVVRRFFDAGQVLPRADSALARASRRIGGSEEGRAAVSFVAVAFAIGLLLVNTSVSQNVMTAGITFNDSLQPQGVAALSWIRTHTPSNATFSDGAGLQTWMWGYAERMDYAPVSLSAEVTQQSLSYSEDADLINLGSYLLSDPYWVVSSSYPSGEGTPQIYLATPGFWQPFLGTEADHDTLLLNGTGGPHWVGLQFANVSTAIPNGSTPELTYNFGLSWTSPNLTARLSTVLRGADFGLRWLAGTAAPIQVNYSFGIPP
ncbi:MAG: hypothetical protein L3K08_05625, partial [Thermoplasmata archaeon]|nr:hypothetical protein [Thermoplasmata archaeon]